MNAARKFVVSNSLKDLNWQNSTLVSGDVVAEIRDLKAQDGPDLLVIGSSNLSQTLLQHALFDEFRLWVFPVVIGRGKRLFGDRTQPSALELTSSKTSTTGVIMNTYVPAGSIPIGSFVPDSPSPKELERRAAWAAEDMALSKASSVS